jgi:hypothetical protein
MFLSTIRKAKYVEVAPRRVCATVVAGKLNKYYIF